MPALMLIEVSFTGDKYAKNCTDLQLLSFAGFLAGQVLVVSPLPPVVGASTS